MPFIFNLLQTVSGLLIVFLYFQIMYLLLFTNIHKFILYHLCLSVNFHYLIVFYYLPVFFFLLFLRLFFCISFVFIQLQINVGVKGLIQ